MKHVFALVVATFALAACLIPTAKAAPADTLSLPASGSQWSASGYVGFNWHSGQQGPSADSGEALLYRFDTLGRWDLSAMGAYSNSGKVGVGGSITRSWAIGDRSSVYATIGVCGISYSHDDLSAGLVGAIAIKF